MTDHDFHVPGPTLELIHARVRALAVLRRRRRRRTVVAAVLVAGAVLVSGTIGVRNRR